VENLTFKNPTASILIIGNEILSGYTKDANLYFLSNQLFEMGIDLLEVRIVRDDVQKIAENVIVLSKKHTYLFTTGGIGATHDDVTVEAIAKAFGVELELNKSVVSLLRDYYKESFNENRKRLAFIPREAHLIENSISHVPSFYIENVYVFAGMPNIMQAMFLGIKDSLKKGQPFFVKEIKTHFLEGDIAHILTFVQNKYESIELGSYPFYEPDNRGVNLILKSRDQEAVQKAFDELSSLLQQDASNNQG
jgi:molybdenum cofactor synthesis domain-containing protein